MALPSRSELIDNLVTTTWQNMKGDAADQIFDATPFWFWLRATGQLDSVEGGRYIEEPLRYAKSENIKWVRKGSSTSLSDKEFLTAAIFDWKYLSDSIVRFGVDDQQNRGKAQIMSYIEAKLQNSEDSLIDELERVLFADGTGTDEMDGLQAIIQDDPTSGTYGGINSGSGQNEWWRNQTLSGSGTAWTTIADTKMTTMLNNCGNNMRQDTPDLILTGQTPYELYEQVALQYKEISNKTLGDAGFQFQQFKGIPMLWSPQCANSRMYFLNSRFLRFKYDPAMFFDMTAWKDIPAQINDRVAQIVLAGNLVTSRRRVHGVIHTIDTLS